MAQIQDEGDESHTEVLVSSILFSSHQYDGISATKCGDHRMVKQREINMPEDPCERELNMHMFPNASISGRDGVSDKSEECKTRLAASRRFRQSIDQGP